MNSSRNTRSSAGRRRLLKGALSIIGVFGVMFGTLVAAPGVAQAAGPNVGIVVGAVSIAPADQQATVGDTLTVSGSWDASAANPQENDTFTIGLPPELAIPQNVPFQLKGPNSQGDETVWANCLTDTATGAATCTLTDAVLADPELVKGEFQFDVQAVAATDAKDVTFNLNGTPTPVALPGGGGIDDGITPPSDWDKSGVMNADHWSIGWTINLPGDRLQGHDVVNVAEQLSDNHQLCDPSGLKVTAIRGDSTTDVTSVAAVVPGADAQDFTFRLTAPDAGWDAKTTYRITYNTCTPDKQIDPKGTEYTNDATVDIWGESSGVIGVKQDWDFHGQISKSGNVLGGADRDGKIAWTVAVDGDNLVGQTSFPFSEELSGDHALCSDTVSGIRVIEQYGPGDSMQTDVTGDLTVTTASSSAQAFDTTVSINGGSSFAFKANPYVYLIRYDTCATTDGLPEGGTQFGNSASVAGKDASGTATVPARSEGKSGGINANSVTVDGVEYLPQTTLNWKVTVPGQSVADVGSDLTVTDTLSDSQVVCAGTGGSVSSRLAVKVQAIDQVSNGGLPTVDLTSTATATLNGNTITFTIPRPTLEQPGGGESTGFSREYQYVVGYTTCTASGGMDAPGTAYGNDAMVNGKTYSRTVTQSNKGSGTGTGMPRGTVAVVKSLADTAGAQFVPADASFTVHAKEIDPSGTVQNEFDLKVPLNGDPVSGPNSRGTGWTIQLSEPTFPTIPGVVFGDPAFAPAEGVTVGDDGTTATAAITPAMNIQVSLTNTAELGALSIVKSVDGPAAGLVDPDQEYAVTAKIDTSALGDDFPAQPDRELAVKAGEPYELADLPIGATVSFSEALPDNDDALTWSPATFTPESITVLPEHASDPATIAVTNHVTRTVGTFSIAKTVTGDQAGNPAVPDDVTVTATWDQEGTPGEKTLTLPTDGTVVPFGEDLLIGTEVTLTETPLADGSSIAWAAPVWSGSGVSVDGQSAVVTVGRDPAAQVSLENHAATSTAGISLIKGVAGEAAGEVDPSTEFPVTATWTDENGDPQSKSLTINTVEPTSLGEQLPAGTVVTITEGDRPTIDTVVWGSVTISGDGVEDNGDGSATITVSDQQGASTLATIVNEATWAPGTFSLSKHVTGVAQDGADVPAAVTVNATWFDEQQQEQSKQLTLPTDGTVVPFGQSLPHGTEVTLTELAPDGSARFSWDAPVWSGEATAGADDSAVVTIAAAGNAEVVLTDHATATLGSLSLTKELTGSGASDVPAGTAFPVTISWTDLLGKTQQVDTHVSVGKATVVDDIPLGTKLSIVEGETKLPDNLRWASVSWSTADKNVTAKAAGEHGVTVTATGESGTTASLTATNEITSTPALAVTGLDVDPAVLVGVAGAAAGLIAMGAWLTLRRRRSSAS